MAEIVKSRFQGILVPDERFGLDNITDEDHATAPSSITAAGPHPGIPAAEQPTRMVLQSSGEQSAGQALKITTARAGHPGLERGGFVWQDDNEDDPADFGWDGPQILSGWQSLFSSTDGTEKDAIPDMIRLQSGKLLMLGLQDKTSFDQTVKAYDPDATTKWSTAGTISLDYAVEQKGASLLQLPSGRVLAYFQVETQVDCYYSDDDGASWGPYSYRCLDTAVSRDAVKQLRARYSSGEVLLLIQYTTALLGETCAQYASDSLGARFVQVTADWGVDTGNAEEPAAIDIAPLAPGFLITYCDTVRGGGAGEYRSRRIGSAFENVTDNTAVAIAAGPTDSYEAAATCYRDASGVAFFLYSNPDATAKEGLVVYRSEDSGATWAAFAGDGAFFSGEPDNGRLVKYKAEEVAGQVILVTRWISDRASEDPQSLAALYLGGFGKHTAPAKTGAVNFSDLDYVSFNLNSTDSYSGGAYIPIADPDDLNWTAGGAGTYALTSGTLHIDTSSNNRTFYRDLTQDDDEQRIFFEIGLSVDLGDGSTSSPEVGAALRLGDDGSGNKYEISLCVSSSGFGIRDDNAGTSVGTATVSFIKAAHVRIAMDRGNVKTWYAIRSDTHFRDWQEGPSGTITSAASTDSTRVTFGNLTAATAGSQIYMVGYCLWPKFWGPTSSAFAADWFSPEDLHSKSYSVLPQQLQDKTSFAAVAGPTRLDESWFIETDYDHPVRHIFPANNASPRATWRSTDTTEHVIAWDISGLAFAHMEHTTIGIALLGINFRTAYLEVRQGATWVEVAEIDAADGFTSLRFDREGEIVFPATTGAAHKARRYLHYGDFEGGTFVDSTNSKYRKIAASTEGAWTDETTKHPRLVLEDVDDTEATTGDCQLWHKDTAALAHSFDSTGRYYRLRIPAQTTADGYFEIGQCLIGPVATFGTQYGRGRQIVGRNITEEIGLPNGELRARKRGPQVREVEFAWVDGLDASNVNIDNPVPDYVNGAATTDPLASQRDAISLMEGVIRRQGGAAKPVVYFARFEADATTEKLNEPRQIVYGRVTSSATRTNILGDEERTNVDRLNTITIRELV